MNPGEIIKTARLREGVSQRELGRRSKVSRGDISHYENGKQTPNMITMWRLMDALDYEIVFKPRYKGGYSKQRSK